MTNGFGMLVVVLNLLTLLSLLAGGAHLVMKIGGWVGVQKSTVDRMGVEVDGHSRRLGQHEERISRIEGVCEERGKREGR